MNDARVQLGLGIGWRPQIALAIDRDPNLRFVEITAENFASAADLPEHLHQLRARGLSVIPHGISLSLEHIAFVRAGGREAGHLLPIARTAASLRVLVENVRRAQDLLPVPLALENISALFEWPDREYDEAEFLTELVERTGVFLLLDVANVYANHRNFGGDPQRFFSRLPLERIAYVHMGGGYENPLDGIYHDTHAHVVPQGALELLADLAARAEPPGVMLERDDDFPDERELGAELGRIRAALQRGRERRGVHAGR